MQREHYSLQLGDITRAEFEANKHLRIKASTFQAGDECVMRIMMPPVGGADYVSDHLVRVEAVRQDEENPSITVLAVSHLEPRSEDWEPGPADMSVADDSMIKLRNVGQRGRKSSSPIPDWPKGLVDMGYFLTNEDAGRVE
ncbi:MAG TPA: hypothetical protein VJY84_02565 [Candidatus Saccharimonadales bacterium]|nr:hypothetical protein [Candidatus Saccharimonadales bacterium]